MQSDENLQQGKDLYFRIECDLGVYPSKHDEKEEILKKEKKVKKRLKKQLTKAE